MRWRSRLSLLLSRGGSGPRRQPFRLRVCERESNASRVSERPKARKAQLAFRAFLFTTMTDLLPLFVNLEGRRVVLVGGGPVAAAKLAQLLAARADVFVVSPEVHEDIERAGVADRAAGVRAVGSGRGLARGGGGDAGGQSRRGSGCGRTTDLRERGGRSGERDGLSERRRAPRRRDPGDFHERRGAGAHGPACVRRSMPCCRAISADGCARRAGSGPSGGATACRCPPAVRCSSRR